LRLRENGEGERHVWPGFDPVEGPSERHVARYFIIGVYFVFVLGIGAVLRSRMQTSEDYFFAPAQPVQGSLGFNVNLWWGLVMVVSGCVILSLASPRRRAAREAANRG
jgi:hypothetical protein